MIINFLDLKLVIYNAVFILFTIVHVVLVFEWFDSHRYSIIIAQYLYFLLECSLDAVTGFFIRILILKVGFAFLNNLLKCRKSA